MYKISEFSKITGLSVKALRYYDEETILTPACRDSETGYRYYSKEDFAKAQRILLLRSLDFSIAEIRDVLENCRDDSDLTCYLEEKRTMIQNRILKEKELIKKMNLYIKPNDREEKRMNYQIEVKDIPSVTVAAIRYRGKYDDTGKYIGKLYKAVKDQGAGAPIQCYHDAEYREEDADLELCLPTKKLIRHPDVEGKTLPAIRAICTTHVGSYSKLNMAYKAIFDYAGENGLACLTPSREVYRKGPGMIFKGNEDGYITDIIVPVSGGVA
ncbi:MerR family transcriptional regulator [Anoxybacterium hadale]|uniref:MerR family transcriptional regulator n=2 Tax=Anoxybacterium hadale TaxID=3408580 RepID=A0ACD1AIB3_9FIRM|nr:MerR family transcriptional regulator [Clostridiales bacterium]